MHPKVTSVVTTVETIAGDTTISYFHNEVLEPRKDRKKTPKFFDSPPSSYTHAEAEQALKVFTEFLNAYVLNWWGIETSTAAFFLLRSWDGSVNSHPYMMEFHEVDLISKYVEQLNIKFIDISNFVAQRPQK